MKNDPEVLIAALTIPVIGFEHLSLEQRVNRDIILACAAHDDEDFYRLLPANLQNDETLCLEMLKAGYYYPKSILDTMPSLLNSREAILGIAKIRLEDSSSDPVPDIISRCRFRDDREVMLAACEDRPELVRYATERLQSDRDFIIAVLNRSKQWDAIWHTTEEFQSENIDVVLKALELCDPCYVNLPGLVEHFAQGIWEHQSIVLTFLNMGAPVLFKLGSHSSLLDNAELVRIAVHTSPSELQYASRRLKGDRDFILSLVKSVGRSLVHAECHLRNDDDILLAAVADTPGALVDCFGSDSNEDFESVVCFASRVRSKLEQHETYMRVFLSGISVSRPHHPPSVRCHLPLLDRGIETSVAFKKLIACFAGIPITKELHLLRKASLNLRKLGY